MPGDDIRRLDWRLFARSDRFHVKEFEADTNANFVVAVDVSRSMDFGWRGIRKLDYARFLAGSLAAFSRSQRDRVGLCIFDHELREFVPPSAKHLETVLQHLARANPPPEPDTRRRKSGASDLGPPLAQLGAALGRRGLVAVVSDFYEPPEQVLAAFDRLLVTGHDIMAFHVLDPGGGGPGYGRSARLRGIGDPVPGSRVGRTARPLAEPGPGALPGSDGGTHPRAARGSQSAVRSTTS